MQALGTQPGCHVMLTLIPLSTSCQRNMPPVLENLTLTLEKDKPHLPLDAHLAMESLSLGCSQHELSESSLYILAIVTVFLYQPCFFLCVVVIEHIIAIITSIFSTQKNGNTGI